MAVSETTGSLRQWAESVRRFLYGVLATALLAWVAGSPATAEGLPRHSPWQGGLAVLKVSSEERMPDVRYRGKRVLVAPVPEGWVAVVGISLNARVGPIPLSVNGQLKRFRVGTGYYGESRIELTDPAYVEPPSAETLRRINRERKELRQAREGWRPQLPDLNLRLPTSGVASTPYGYRRYINDELRSSHRGLDIAAAEGTPVLAALGGVVTLAADLFYTGYTLVIDHGMGLYSLYAHMSELGAEVGDEVRAGDRIGAVGMTGRSTGAHLHWGVTLNGATIDPALLLNESDLRAIQLDLERGTE